MTRGKPQINTSPLAGRFSIGKEDTTPPAEAEPEPDSGQEPPPAADTTPEPDNQPGGGTAPEADTIPATSKPRDKPRKRARDQPREQAREKGSSLGQDLGIRQGASIPVSRLRRRSRDNPWKVPRQVASELPAFLREYLRTSVALTGGEEKLKDLLADAIILLAVEREELELLEDAWIGEGGPPGAREDMRP